MSERRSIARDLAATGCGCDEDIADHCVHMQDGCCTYTAFWIEKALDDAHAVGREAGMREAAKINKDLARKYHGVGQEAWATVLGDAADAIISAIGEPKT